MKKIRSVNEVNGQMYKNNIVNLMIENVIKDIGGIKTFKVYKYDNDINIVLIIDKDCNILNILDGSLEKAECLLIDDFRFQSIKVNVYVLEK